MTINDVLLEQSPSGNAAIEPPKKTYAQYLAEMNEKMESVYVRLVQYRPTASLIYRQPEPEESKNDSPAKGKSQTKAEPILQPRREETGVNLVRRAFLFSEEKHRDQVRKSGEPYLVHPVAVTAILSELETDEVSLAAGLLHDIVEDCPVTLEDIVFEFGSEVATLVDGLTKLQIVDVDEGKEKEETQDELEMKPATAETLKKRMELTKNAANIRKLFVAMAKDLRVIIIKLADRLHNMRTLSSLSPVRQYRMASETLHIFAPLAHRLGIWQLKWQLEDLAFKYVEPEAFNEVSAMVARNRSEREDEVKNAIDILQNALLKNGIQGTVKGRPKHLYSIYNKMKEQSLNFSDLFDLTALRVIVHTHGECYQTLGVVSGLWIPIPDMYTDYIAQSKGNLYQSLHIKVFGPTGAPIEVQIRTWEMHRTAEFGLAAHWQYKEGGKTNDNFEMKLASLRQQMFDWQAENKDPTEFLQNVKDDFLNDLVFVRTPKGDIFELPAGSTPVDFAFRVHSDVGQHCVGARVNLKPVPLNYQFKNQDMIEIVTRKDASPSRDWLSFVKTSNAKSRIKHHFKRLNFTEHVQAGREMLERELSILLERDPKAWGENPKDLLKDESLHKIAPLFNVAGELDLLAALGSGTASVTRALNKLKPNSPITEDAISIGGKRTDDRKAQIITDGSETGNVLFRRSRCCLPIPGDDVVGYITQGNGWALHRRICANLQQTLKTEPQRTQNFEYKGNEGQVFQVFLTIECLDRTNLLSDVGFTFGESKTNITAVRTQSHPDKTATIELAIEARDTRHLATIFQKVRNMGDILDIRRTSFRQESKLRPAAENKKKAK